MLFQYFWFNLWKCHVIVFCTERFNNLLLFFLSRIHLSDLSYFCLSVLPVDRNVEILLIVISPSFKIFIYLIDFSLLYSRIFHLYIGQHYWGRRPGIARWGTHDHPRVAGRHSKEKEHYWQEATGSLDCRLTIWAKGVLLHSHTFLFSNCFVQNFIHASMKV